MENRLLMFAFNRANPRGGLLDIVMSVGSEEEALNWLDIHQLRRDVIYLYDGSLFVKTTINVDLPCFCPGQSNIIKYSIGIKNKIMI